MYSRSSTTTPLLDECTWKMKMQERTSLWTIHRKKNNLPIITKMSKIFGSTSMWMIKPWEESKQWRKLPTKLLIKSRRKKRKKEDPKDMAITLGECLGSRKLFEPLSMWLILSIPLICLQFPTYRSNRASSLRLACPQWEMFSQWATSLLWAICHL